MPPSGVEVRGLRVLRTHEARRVPWWPAQALTSFPAIHQWSVLTVSGGQGEVLARRRFKRDHDADDARRRFVGLVAELSDDDYATADWQAVLDSA